MSNFKCKTSSRLLAAFLSFVMVISMFPLTTMTALAATTEHPDAVTVTVVDDDGLPVQGATVAFTIDSIVNGDAYKTGSLTTDDKGVVEVLAAADFVADDLTIAATITADGHDSGEITEQAIVSAEQDIQGVIKSNLIKDVTITWNENLEYTGNPLSFVSVTEIEGDTIEYEIDGQPADKAEKTDAGTYTVKVTVKRTDKEDLTATKDITISPKALEIGVTANTNLVYNKDEQALVSIPTGLVIGDKVTWIVNDGTPESYIVNKTNINNVPKATNVGEYTVKLSVERNANYTVYKSEEIKELKAVITATKIDNLSAELVSGLVYNGADQELVKKNEQDDAYVSGLETGDKVYFIVGTDETTVMASDAWTEWTESVLPVGKDAATYTVRIKVVRTNYNDTEVELDPTNVTIAKATQDFAFVESNPDADTVTVEELNNGLEYNFAAVDNDKKVANSTFTYSLELEEEDKNIATIGTDGKLVVTGAGVITVVAELSGDNNYDKAVKKQTIEITVGGGLVSFAKDEIDYTVGDNNGFEANVATKTHNDDRGSITYSIIDSDKYGLKISKSGVVSVDNYDKLAAEVSKSSGELTVTVKVDKAVDKNWRGNIRYEADSDTYKIKITFLATPVNPYTLSAVDGTNDWYKTTATVTPVDGYKIAKNAGDVFDTTVTFNEDGKDQGTDVRYVYLKDTTTGCITDKIAVNIKIDSVNPDKLNIQFSELNLMEKIGQSLGFYNPSVTITFTAEDATSGIDHFDWTYTPENGEPVTKEIAVSVEGNKATATLTLPADEAEQLHGKISFTATDKASNEIGKSDDYTFIVDTIAPELSVKYQGQAPYEAKVDAYNGADFFNSNVEVELTITETNFYDEDVVVKVSKNGEEATPVTPSWNGNVGTFTLSGDGDYVVYVTYTDKAHMEMIPYTSEVITVDTTAPIVKIEYVHDGNVQKTIFTVIEHNFRASDVVITGDMKDIAGNDVNFTGAQLTEILQAATWKDTGNDTYTYEYDQYVNGIYDLRMDYQDVADWNATQYVADQFIIDHGIPTNVTIEYAKTPLDTFLEVITLGFYNPSVTVRFTAYDTSSGVESFTWSYKKQDGASVINHPDSVAETTVVATQDSTDKTKFTATITITAEEAAQYRGSLSVFATDTFKNKSVTKVDNGNVIVVDNVAPTMTVEYSTADRVVDTTKTSYYNNDILVTFKVTEANFYSEDVKVFVSKDGGAPYSVDSQITWGERDENDLTVGTMTLAAPADHTGDGDYVITVEYTDKSSNVMTKYTSDVYTIDTIAPVIGVDYKNTTVVNTLKDKNNNDRKYFADTQTAVVTINEHNFVEGEVDFTIIARDVTGAELDVSALNTKTAWSHEGDVHTITITYPGDANYTFDVKYTDLATNEAADYATDYFTVDKTDATNLTVSYSTSVLDTVLESLSFGFYNAKMTVTITAEDPTSGVHSFLYSYKNAPGVSSVNAELINQAIEAADIQYSEDGKKATVTFEIPKMVLGNDNQFNGTVEFTATDRSGNGTDPLKDDTRIVVDNIAPTAQVGYNEATNVVGDISYYNGNINATVTITEANFYANDVQVMVSKDGGAATAVTPTWKDNSVDVHVGTFTLTEDGDYVVTINYKDKSSNTMATYTSKQMTIDTKIEAPTYTVNGEAKTEEGGAYKGDATIGFNFEDQNFDTKTIKLTRTRFDSVEDVTEEFIKVNDVEKGGNGTFTIPSEVGNDGIYILTIGMTDKALHTTESQIKFTINRYGSVYEYNDYLVSLIKDGGQYITISGGEKAAITDDLVITEYNADQLLEGSLKILITRDGEAVEAVYATNPENINNQVGVGDSGWYQYVYTISASNFAEDGVYRITLSSQYGASDSETNDSTSVPDNSIDAEGNKILDTMNFTVDTKAPEIRNIVNLEEAIINAQTVDVKYTIVDVGGLKSIEVILNGETIDTITEFGDSAFNYSGQFTINESSSAQTVQLKVTDLAGNVTDTASDDFSTGDLYVFNDEVTVSTNFFVRWYANTGLFWGSIGGVIVLAGAVLFLVAYKRKKKEEK